MGIKLIRGCLDGKFIAEGSFEKEIDINKFLSLHNPKMINVKCSKELGIARFVFKNKEITLYTTGRVNINKISNRREAEVLVEKITCIIQDVFIE